jgi:hypothetical protein
VETAARWGHNVRTRKAAGHIRSVFLKRVWARSRGQSTSSTSRDNAGYRGWHERTGSGAYREESRAPPLSRGGTSCGSAAAVPEDEDDDRLSAKPATQSVTEIPYLECGDGNDGALSSEESPRGGHRAGH